MVDSKEKTRKSTSSRKSRNSGSSSRSRRSSTRNKSGSSGNSNSQSPNRSEPRRSKRSKEDLEAKDRARSERDSDNVEVNAVDHTGTVVPLEASDDSGRKHRSSKRRSQQDRGIAKDNVAKAKELIDRSNQPNTGPAPGAHANSRGDQVAKEQKSKGRFNRHMGSQSVISVEERTRMEAEKAKEQDGLVMANTVDESQDEQLAMAFLNSMLDNMQESDHKSKGTKHTLDKKTKMSTSDSSQDSKKGDNEDSDEKDWEKSKLKKGVCIFRYLCCVIVLAAGGVGAWIALRENNNNSTTSDTIEPSLDVPINATAENNTNGPDSTQDPINSGNPNPISTGAPSGAPISNHVGGDDLIFDPLSIADCAAITNGGSIQGQDAMPVQNYQLDLDASSFLPMDLSISAGLIEEKLRELLAPVLTGCNRDARKLRLHHRQQSEDADFAYAIGNVLVDARGIEGVPCLNDLNPNCHRVSVALDIVVKDATVKVSTVIRELSLFFGGGILANKLELADLYISIIVVNLGTTETTESPSINDNSPSTEPSKAPLAASSPNFSESPTSTSFATPFPTSSPGVQETQRPTSSSTTPGPTPPPTPDQGSQETPTSQSPTKRPTPFPTLRPTPFPSARPVSFPTFPPDPTPLPSTSPTQMPSADPTSAPVIPSQPPSTNPSPSPSEDPTGTPISIPTSGPTRSPSSQPTPQPSPSPSPAPTPSPTDQPSAAPSTPPPVLVSISTDRCGYLESVLGNRVSLHQLAIDWMCNTDTWEPSEEESYPEQWHDRYAMSAFLYAANNDDPQTFNDDTLSDASTRTTCSWWVLQGAWGMSCATIPGSKVQSIGHDLFLIDGYIPTAIGLLTNVQSILFQRGHTGRSYPTEIGRLTALTRLMIYPDISSYETYRLPTEIGALSLLETLRLGGLVGTIPSVLMSLKNLQELQLFYDLTGTIPPSIVGLTKLTFLGLISGGVGGGNLGLTGTVPPLPTAFTTGWCRIEGGSFDDVTNAVSANCDTS